MSQLILVQQEEQQEEQQGNCRGHTKHGGQMGRSRMKSGESTKSAGYATL